MIKLPKKLFVNLISLLSVLIFLLSLPTYFFFYLKILSFKTLAIFYFANAITGFFLLGRYSRKKYQLQLLIEDIQEKVNILNNRNLQEIKNKSALEEKIKRYTSLRLIIEKVSKNLDLDYIADNITDIAFFSITANRGVCILYTANTQTAKLSVFKTKKEDKTLIIKAKEGDIFDFWVLRHTTPLLVEDAKKDFRFDTQCLESRQAWPVLSLISSPFISETKFLGLIRLDNKVPNFYSQDDLRFLSAISDIGAVALENGELFQKTQKLAIHDGLTNLHTKGYFLKRLKEEAKRCIRQRIAVSLLMLDIDYFKNYNDKFGHTAGDIVLKDLSSNLTMLLKDTNTVISRFGGEEFCVLLMGKDKFSALKIADDLCLKIGMTKINLRRAETNITVSIGAASMPEDTLDEGELIRIADRAMYEAKAKGRNRAQSA